MVVVPSLHDVFQPPDCACEASGIAALMNAAAAAPTIKRERDIGPSEGVARLTRCDSSGSPGVKVREITFAAAGGSIRQLRIRSTVSKAWRFPLELLPTEAARAPMRQTYGPVARVQTMLR